MVERFGGKGGFGAIASDNTDQREGKYAPHRAVSVTHDPGGNPPLSFVKCLKCNQAWTHPWRDPWGSAPAECAER